MKQRSAAERRLGFRIHAIVFIPVMIALLLLNLWLGAPYWIHWVLLAWGIGLLSHGLSVRWHGAREARNS
jgi:hypothetical protein